MPRRFRQEERTQFPGFSGCRSLRFESLEDRMLLATGTEFGSNSSDVSIPDYPGMGDPIPAESNIVISSAPANSVVTSVDVEYWVNHSYIGDLRVRLVTQRDNFYDSPYFWNLEGGGGTQIHEVEMGLATFNGIDPNGTWTLQVEDHFAVDTGYIDQWNINVHWQTAPGSANITVENQNGSTVTDQNASVKLYHDGTSTTDYTNGSGVAQFSTIGSEVSSYEVYYDGPGGTEYWGDDSVSIPAGGTAADTFTRFYPFVSELRYYDVTAGDYLSGPLPDGHTVQPHISVENRVSQSLDVQVQVIVDRDQAASWDYDQTSSFVPVSGGGGSTLIPLPSFTPIAGESYDQRYWLTTQLLNGSFPYTDTAGFYDAFDVEINQGSANITVRNQNGSIVTDQNASVKLYHDGTSTTDYTNSSGVAQFSNIGSEVSSYEVYYDGPGGTEYWGDDAVSIPTGGTVSDTFTRFYPFVSQLLYYDVTNGGTLVSGPLPAGHEIRPLVTVTNNVSQSLDVQAQVIVDRDQAASWDYDQTSSLVSVAGGGGSTQILFSSFTPIAGENYDQRYWLTTELLNLSLQLTDSDTFRPAFSVDLPALPPITTGRIAWHAYTEYSDDNKDGTYELDGQIYVHDFDTGLQHPLANPTISGEVTHAHNPNFSGDGRFMTFMGLPAGPTYGANWRQYLDVFLYDFVTDRVTNISASLGLNTFGQIEEDSVLSPDGSKVVFKRNVADIWETDVFGSSMRQVTTGPGEKSGPQYSPDGNTLVFWIGGGADSYLATVPANASTPQVPIEERNNPFPKQDYFPSYWDAERILYTSWDDPYWDAVDERWRDDDDVKIWNVTTEIDTFAAFNRSDAEDSDPFQINSSLVGFSTDRSSAKWELWYGDPTSGAAADLGISQAGKHNLGAEYTLMQISYVPPSADADDDGDVDGLDFLAWQRGFGTAFPNASKSDGDADNDLDVDDDDLSVWESQYGTGSGINNGLIAHYNFDGNANDASGNSNHGTEFGGITFVPGLIGQAGSFDGNDDYIDLPGGLLTGDSDFSVSKWINLGDLPIGPPYWKYIVDLREDINHVAAVKEGNLVVASGLGATVDFDPVPIDVWHHVAYTYDDTEETIRVYQNGQYIGSQPGNVPSGISGRVNRIGAYSGALSDWFDGEIDDLKIWNRVLTAQEVASIATLPSPIVASAPTPSVASEASIQTHQTLSPDLIDAALAYELFSQSSSSFQFSQSALRDDQPELSMIPPESTYPLADERAIQTTNSLPRLGSGDVGPYGNFEDQAENEDLLDELFADKAFDSFHKGLRYFH